MNTHRTINITLINTLILGSCVCSDRDLKRIRDIYEFVQMPDLLMRVNAQGPADVYRMMLMSRREEVLN